MSAMKDILVPISPGELLDKITILRIKAARIDDADKLRNVRLELDLLEKTWRDSGCAVPEVAADETELQRVNEALWVIEVTRSAPGNSTPSSSNSRAPFTSPTISVPRPKSASTWRSVRVSSKRNPTSPIECTQRCSVYSALQ
jgi:hypothetical protein